MDEIKQEALEQNNDSAELVQVEEQKVWQAPVLTVLPVVKSTQGGGVPGGTENIFYSAVS